MKLIFKVSGILVLIAFIVALVVATYATVTIFLPLLIVVILILAVSLGVIKFKAWHSKYKKRYFLKRTKQLGREDRVKNIRNE